MCSQGYIRRHGRIAEILSFPIWYWIENLPIIKEVMAIFVAKGHSQDPKTIRRVRLLRRIQEMPNDSYLHTL